MGLKTKKDIAKKQDEILNNAPGGSGIKIEKNINDLKKTKPKVVKPDKVKSKEVTPKEVAPDKEVAPELKEEKIYKRFSVKVDEDLYVKWLKYSMEMKIARKEVSFQKVVEAHLRELLN